MALPYNFVNGTTADALQVDANMAYLLTGQTTAVAITGGTAAGLSSLGVAGFTPSFKPGAQAGTSTWMGWLLERAPGQIAADNLWPSSNSEGLVGISELAAAATDPTGAVGFLAPRWGLYIDVKTTDTALHSVSLGLTNLSYTAGAKIQGANIIVGGQGAAPALVAGIEIDMQGVFNATTFSECVEFQVFNGITVDVGGRFTANGTGKFVNGWDFSGAPFTTAAIKLGNNSGTNGQLIRFEKAVAGTAAATISATSTNDLVTAYSTNAFWGDGATSTFQLTGPVVPAGSTSMAALVNNNAGINLVAIQLGAVDSGGAGFRALRVAN